MRLRQTGILGTLVLTIALFGLAGTAPAGNGNGNGNSKAPPAAPAPAPGSSANAPGQVKKQEAAHPGRRCRSPASRSGSSS